MSYFYRLMSRGIFDGGAMGKWRVKDKFIVIIEFVGIQDF
jgi:hypothetical protein